MQPFLGPPPDISEVMGKVEELPDASIAAEGYIIHDVPAGEEPLIDLSKIDFEMLQEKRGVAEGLTEEELALFDILSKPDPKLTKAQEAEVKKVAKGLLEILKAEKLVLDWRSRQQSRAVVRQFIKFELDKLPEAYAPDIYDAKCDLTYRHVYDHYYGPGQSVYEEAA